MPKRFKVALIIGDSDLLKILKEVIKGEERFKIIAEFSQAVTCSRIVKELKPDMLMIDDNISPISGFTLSKKVKQNLPLCQIIFINRDFKDTEYRNERFPFIDIFFDQHDLFTEFENLKNRLIFQAT